MAGLDYTELVTERTRGFTRREWVFEAIDGWLGDPGGARVFLLTGRPGTGKTAIAAQLVQMAEGEVPAELYPNLGASSIQFFQFCQAFHNDTLDPLRFTKHLSLNLASAYPPFAEALIEAGVRYPGVHVSQQVETADRAVIIGAIIQDLHIGNLSARVAFDRVVAAPLKQIPQADPPATILILLDALDEALTYPGETLVDLLAHVLDDPHDLPDQIRFLLTSRPDGRVPRPLGEPALDLIADAPADVDDVQAYAHRRLRALDEPRRSDLASRIAEVSQGNFLYARYVIDDLPSDLDQVEDPAELPLPKDLPDVYRQFLRRELGRSLDTWDDDFVPLLGILAVARGDGLTSAQLAGVTKQRGNTMRRLLRTCGQYLAGPQPDGPLRIYHQSFREFLLEDSTYRVFPQESNGDIADFYLGKYSEKWEECDTYGLRHLPIHMVGAGQNDTLRELLLDFDWLQAKLDSTDVTALIADTDLLPADANARRVGGALRLSAHVLAGDKAQLWSQLYGRLVAEESPAIQEMLEDWPEELWLRPLRPSLTAPGGPLLRTLEGHTDLVNAVAVCDGGRRAISASSDHTLKVWDLERGQELRTLEGHTHWVTAVEVYDGGRRAVSGSHDNTLKVWDLEGGQELRTLEGHTDWVRAVAVYDGGRRTISASDDRTLKVWDLESGDDLRTLEGHTDLVKAVAVYDGGRRAISASRDTTLKVWDLERGQQLRTLEGHSSPIEVVAVYDGGRRAISASWDNTLKVWDLEDGQELRTLEGHNRAVNAVAVYDGGRRAIFGSDDATLTVWDLEGGQELRTLEGHSLEVEAVAVYDGGRRAISASRDTTLKIWDLSKIGLEGGQELRTLEGHGRPVTAVAVYDGGRRAISASWDNTIKVWDLEGGQDLCTLEGHTHWVKAVAVYDGGRRAISASRDTTLKVWDLERRQVLRTLEGHGRMVTAVAVYDGGRRAISASWDNTIKVWDLEGGQELRTLEGHTDLVNAVAVYDGGRRAISASWDDTLKVWDLERGQELRTLEGHRRRVNAVAMYDGGRRAISASDDHTLKVWDLEGGRELRTLEGHTDSVHAVAVYAGGRRVISASEDHTLKVWDLGAGVSLATFSGDTTFGTCAVAPDGRTVVAGDHGGHVHILRLEGGRLKQKDRSLS
jgi:WD40 repeat protein